MSNKIIKINKKGQQQYYPTPSYGTVHPVLIIGIIIFVLPYILPVFGVNSIADWLDKSFTFVGILTILIGAALSIYKASN